MEFEWKKATKIEETSSKFLDNTLDDDNTVHLDQVSCISDTKINSLEVESLETLLKSNVETGILLGEGLQNYKYSFTDLPAALISEIFNFLDPKELGIVSCVCTSLYTIASEHHVWKEVYCETWGHPGNADGKSWKEQFVEREYRSKTFMGRYSIDTLCGHKEAVRTVFVLASRKLVFTSGYDQVVRMWDLEEGLSIASSQPLGCTIRAVAADSRLLVAGGTYGFIHGWKAEDNNPHLFDLRAVNNPDMEFRVWEHRGPITCLALDFSKMYSGSWDTTVRIWDRSSLACLQVLEHNDWVWSLASHDNTLASTAGSSVYNWDTVTGDQLSIANNVHVGNAYSLARSHTGKLLFTGGEDGSIQMFEIVKNVRLNVRKIATWTPHSGSVYSLAFEFPWLVGASGDGKVSLIDVRRLLKIGRRYTADNLDRKNVEPPQRVLHGFGCSLFSVDIGSDRIICGGDEGVVRVWNFSQALEIEQRVQTLRGIKLQNRLRRRNIQMEMKEKGSHGEQCSVAAKKNQKNNEKSDWHSKRRVSGKLKA